MNQIVCDRCREVVPERDEEKVRELATVERVGGHMTDLGDFCPKCLVEFRAWLNPPRAAKGRPTPKSTLRRRRS